MEIDLNSDLGEGLGRWRMGDDEALMKLVSSANVACGFHAGDAVIMTRMVEAAKENGVALGAHVGLPDILGFGRIPMKIDPRDMQKHALYQLGALSAIAKVNGYKVTHAGTHGALGQMAQENKEYIEKILEVFAAFDRDLIIAASVKSHAGTFAKSLGLRVVGKIFADRAYDDEARLVNRRHPGALITDLTEVARRMSQFLDDGTITSVSGKRIKVDAKCVLVHSDTPGAVEIARAVRTVVEDGGGRIVPLTELAA
ncbi:MULTISPECIES: LamB/YcsF family protein [Bradyrhizobium]|uniref:5-oxoprolinase subunit PxpA n=3 Tax=Bradyrhizobium TaxID=374 RepID=A0AAE5X841_9BRAD|nr:MULTISPECIES: 5-oxoprolinase subunit PxpA [Bradyrhizobium]MCG2629343.1 LamB/YcsF family protein [Bradyrhizobium zhengyangense]MCG2644624.1 LamB/YcsF family protein [Bradyrhizobium zhengyangense]MCG2670857.1 LamB/YcsF family protein [Bradyrhizobium zhengyangense]MDN4984490.1 5-oxoprolinase subunit PxpA [Bradyrhizobium sp. WYCCWR 13022]MDN5002482.1 5-oxoprolinase subunit PxpA [Bradyrhizobium sp. WYCCWR 12677]